MQQHERFLIINALMDRGFALEYKLMRPRVSMKDVSQTDAQAWYDTYMTWHTETLPNLDGDLQKRFNAAHAGTSDRLGTRQLLQLLVRACEPDPEIADPARLKLRPGWHSPFEDPLHVHLETLFPIRLDDAVLAATSSWAVQLRTRHIGDFRDWKQYDEYQQVFQQLLRALRRARTDYG